MSPCTRVSSLLLLSLALLLPATARAERPPMTELLPKETLLLVRVPDSKDLIARFKETSIGRIGNDEKIRPLVQHLYGSAAKAYEAIEKELGVSLSDLLTIPQGEAFFALVAPEKRIAPILFVQIGDKAPAIEKLLEAGERAAVNNGSERSTEKLSGVEVKVLTSDNGKVLYVIHEGVLIISTEAPALEDLLRLAKGDGLRVEREPLAKNDKFNAVMSKCLVNKDTPAQVMWFVDPIELAMTAARGNAAASTGLALLPVIGVDGLHAAGGTITFATEEFDSIMHTHVLLANPRSGVLEALTLGGGDTEPEPWVPGDAAAYMTLHWDVQESYNVVSKLLDSLRGEGSTARAVDRAISGPAGVDFQKDLLPALDGRFTMVTWIEPPARFNSQATMIAVKLRDAKAFQETFDKVIAKFEDRFEKKTTGATTYWQFKNPNADAANQPADQPQPGRPRPFRAFAQLTPCVAILGDYLVAADRPGMLERAVTQAAHPDESLAHNLEYKLIASRIRKQLSGVKPGMVSFNRPEEGLRNLYEMATNQENLDRLGQQEQNPFFKALHDGLKENPLPPFSVISQYLAPGGSILVNDETGFHHIGFSLRRK